MSLCDLPGIIYTAILETPALKKFARTKNQSIKIDASITISGTESLFDKVGEAIANARGYLQHPLFLSMGTEYVNPHWVYPHNVRTDLRHLIGPASTNSRNARLGHLPKSKMLRRLRNHPQKSC
jgi:hypothetical protein